MSLFVAIGVSGVAVSVLETIGSASDGGGLATSAVGVALLAALWRF